MSVCAVCGGNDLISKRCCLAAADEIVRYMEAELARLRARLAEATALLREVDDQMATWFSSEYAEHGARRKVAAFLRGAKGDK